MILYRILFFLLITTFSFAGNLKSLSNIKTMDIKIEEFTNINNKNKKVVYDLKFIKPNMARKEILSPVLNKGEIYIYTGNKKTVYLPMFEQTLKEEVSNDENNILESLNYILDIEKKNKDFVRKYYSKKLKEIELKNGTKIEIKDLRKVEDYLLPYQFIIYQGDTKVATLNIESYKINSKISEKEFVLND